MGRLVFNKKAGSSAEVKRWNTRYAGKQVCAWCGLVALRNKASEWCVEKGCQYKLHTSYPATMKKLTRQFEW
ncbi:hypothetical protein P1A145kb_p051 [Pectobacterium phage DU_PP_I]|nr:hypothetical protein P1A145kb_p051 [Pectobacterium phage DU_PP_I]ATS93767.1 hypothetical protein P12B145kb_p051 [Pectobacterium phage DU_PP_IV]